MLAWILQVFHRIRHYVMAEPVIEHRGNIMRRTTLRLLWPSVGLLLSLVTPGILASDVLDQWYWRNPRPDGNDLHGVAYGNGTFVVVGTLGTIMTSTDGHAWEHRTSGTDKQLNHVIFAQDTFLAIGESGVMLSSTNGADWVSHPTSPSYSLRGITFGQGKYVVVGSRSISDQYSQIILSSDRLEQWTVKEFPSVQPFNSVTYGNGLFMVVSGGALTVKAMLMSSTNGVDWTDLSRDDIISLTSVAYGNGAFVTVNSIGDIWTTSDGTNWLFHTTSGFPALHDVSFVDGQFLIVGDRPFGSVLSTLLTSTNGIDWESRDSSAADPLNAVTGGDGQYVAVGQHGQIVSSMNSQPWAAETTYAFGHGGWFSAVAFGKGRFVSVGDGKIGSSTNGITWQMANSVSPNWLIDVTFGDGRFLGVGLAGTILWSDDGINWLSSSVPPEIALSDAACGVGVYVVGGLSSVGNGWVFASTNLTEWKTVYQATNQIPRSIVYGNGRFVVSLSNADLLVSTNGLDWIRVSPGVGISDMVFANERFVAIEGQSTNGVDWIFNSAADRNFASMHGLADIAFGDGIFIATDASGLIDPVPPIAITMRSGGGSLWSSDDGVHWTKRFNSPFTLLDAAFGNGTFVGVGEHGVVVQSTNLDALVPIRLSGSMATNQVFELTITSASGLDLTVETSSDLQTWQIFRHLVNQTGQTNLFETVPSGNTQRFYRARTSN
jgi:hypothetical protein